MNSDPLKKTTLIGAALILAAGIAKKKGSSELVFRALLGVGVGLVSRSIFERLFLPPRRLEPEQ